MTEDEFKEKFHGVITPSHAGARMPEFDPAGVNERNIPHEMRYKEYGFDFFEGEGGDKVNAYWKSQEWADGGAKALRDEIKRCLAYVGFSGRVRLSVASRDGAWRKRFSFSVK